MKSVTMATSYQIEDEIQWDGESLAVWVVTNRGRIRCEIHREAIHEIPLFGDAISREIDRDRREIVDRIRPILLTKVTKSDEHVVQLHPSDLSQAFAK
jgi:hypothetical protein